jgi:hypothetical protein
VRLGLSETTPLNWTSPRNFVLAEEGFPRDVVRQAEPTLRALDPSSLRELEDLVPEVLPVELAPPIEATAAIEPSAPVEPEDSVESGLP